MAIGFRRMVAIADSAVGLSVNVHFELGQRDHSERLKICLNEAWSLAIGSTDNTLTVRTTPLCTSIGTVGAMREVLFRPLSLVSCVNGRPSQRESKVQPK